MMQMELGFQEHVTTMLKETQKRLARLEQKAIVPGDHPFLYRKDIANIIKVSTDMVRTNERRLGLDIARVDINARVVRYHTDLALQQLAYRGQITSDNIECLM